MLMAAGAAPRSYVSPPKAPPGSPSLTGSRYSDNEQPMQDTYLFSTNITIWEYIRLAWTITPRIKQFRRIFILWGCIGLFVVLSTTLSMITGSTFNAGQLWQGLLLPLYLIGGFFALVTLSALLIGVVRPQFRLGINYRFNHWGMEMTGQKQELSVPWRQFQKIKETKSFFLLYIMKNNIPVPHPILKRALGTAEDAVCVPSER
jgi:hypothetical protein